MKEILLIALHLVVSFVNCELFELPIIHLNDFHARFEEVSEYSTRCTDDNCIGGFSRIYSMVTRIQRERNDSIFLNAGDNFQGTLWYNVHKWNVTQYFFNKLKTDAYTLGNHEFDSKIDGLVPFLQHLKSPVVVSNIDDRDEPRIQGLFRKSVVLLRNNRKIGIIGVILQSTDAIVDTEKLRFTDEVDAVNREAKRLVHEENCKIIIVLSHCGLDVDVHIAENAGPHVSLVVGGHTHTFLYTGDDPPGPEDRKGPYPVVVLNKQGKTVLVVQASFNSIYLGNISVWYNEEGGIVRWEGNPIFLDKSVPKDPIIDQELSIWKQSIDDYGGKLLGFNKVLLDRKNRRKGESNIGSFLTDAMVDYFVKFANPDEWTYSSVAILNSGAIRTSIPPGNITVGDLITAQPFNNTIDCVLLSGKTILEILEYSVTPSKVRKNQLHEFLQFSGLRVVFDTGKPVGSRVVRAKILCNKCRVPSYSDIDVNADYKVLMPWFLRNGGDGFNVIRDNVKNVTLFGVTDEEVYSKYIEKMSPITQKLDERIVLIASDSGSAENKSTTVLPQVLAVLVYAVMFLKID